jgi:hypothetical protein
MSSNQNNLFDPMNEELFKKIVAILKTKFPEREFHNGQYPGLHVTLDVPTMGEEAEQKLAYEAWVRDHKPHCLGAVEFVSSIIVIHDIGLGWMFVIDETDQSVHYSCGGNCTFLIRDYVVIDRFAYDAKYSIYQACQRKV